MRPLKDNLYVLYICHIVVIVKLVIIMITKCRSRGQTLMTPSSSVPVVEQLISGRVPFCDGHLTLFYLDLSGVMHDVWDGGVAG